MIGRRFRVFLAALLACLATGGVASLAAPDLIVELPANCFSLVYLGLTLGQLPRLSAEHLRHRARDDDAPTAVIFTVTGAIVVVALVSLFHLINFAGGTDQVQLFASVTAVLLGWLVVHTMAALHYAFEYYDAEHGGGLDFPGSEPPDGLAFIYFSYVVGMTAQVADVAVTSGRMRRLVVIHGLFAFFFNTAIIAATVNVVVSLGNG